MSTEIEIPETGLIEPTPEPVQEAESDRHPSPRELAMAKIAEHAEEKRQEEIAQGLIYDQDARDAGLTHEEDAPEPIADAETKTEAAPPPAPIESELRTVTIDGRTFQVTNEQHNELARLGMVANIALHTYQQPAQQQAQPQYQQPTQQEITDDLYKETVRKIQYGGEEDGAAALKQLVTAAAAQMPQPQYIDQQAIVQQAVAMAQQQQQFQADAALIQKEYADVFADPQRTQLANLNVNAIRQRNIATGKYQDELSVYREAGDMVLDALKLPRPNTGSNTPALQAASSRADVVERKRAAPKATMGIDRRSPAPTTPRAPSGSEIVERIRAARGQASMM